MPLAFRTRVHRTQTDVSVVTDLNSTFTSVTRTRPLVLFKVIGREGKSRLDLRNSFDMGNSSFLTGQSLYIFRWCW